MHRLVTAESHAITTDWLRQRYPELTDEQVSWIMAQVSLTEAMQRRIRLNYPQLTIEQSFLCILRECGYNQREIGEILGVPHRTVKRRFQKMRQSVK